MTPFIRRSLGAAAPRAASRSTVARCPLHRAAAAYPAGAPDSAEWPLGHLGQDGISQTGPGPCRPQPERAVAEAAAEHAGHRVHPEERAGPAEMPERLRCVG